MVSNIPDLTASVSPPRVAAVGYPIGLPMGRPGDSEGQIGLLRAVLDTLVEIETPGIVKHLQFEWQEEPAIHTHHPESPPIIKLLVKKPLFVRKLIKHEIPEQYQT